MHFAKTLHSVGFNPTGFNPDFWYTLRDDKKRYDYISTYVDDFLITAKDPDIYMKALQKIYTIKISTIPDYYLGTNYIGSVDTNWCITAKQYILESINQIKTRLSIQLRKEWTHRRLKTTLKMDTTLFLDTYLHQEYQALIEMLQWVVTISRAEICFATSSLSQFFAAPREGHLS